MDEAYQVPIQIRSDENGFYDRECPNEECLFTFKVDLHDWEEKIAGNDMHCPRCGHVAFHDQWFTQGQLEAINENVMSFAMGLVHDELKASLKSLERKTRNNRFVRITYRPGRKPQYADLPITQGEEWATEITCPDCKMRFSVIGSAYFCPCCGKDLSTTAVMDSLASYRKRIQSFDGLREFFRASNTVEEAERQIDSLREDTLGSIVSTFESFAKARFAELGGTGASRGAFQRLYDGDRLFADLTGERYADYSSEDDIYYMFLMFQKRHLFTHNNGVVDTQYIDRTGDTAYSAGERIVLKDEELLRLIDVVDRVISGLMCTGNCSVATCDDKG